jgi:hypothetical protein
MGKPALDGEPNDHPDADGGKLSGAQRKESRLTPGDLRLEIEKK